MGNINYFNGSKERLHTVCPKCGSTKVQFSAINVLVGPPYHPVCQNWQKSWSYIPEVPKSENIFTQIIRKLSGVI